MGQGITNHRIRRIEDRLDTAESDIDSAETGTTVDHGGLLGLSDDDHPQYPALSHNETITGAWTFSDQVITTSPTAGGVGLFGKVTGSAVDAVDFPAALYADCSSVGSMVDGFGAGLYFGGTDDTASGLFGYISGVRDGGDNDGKLVFSPYSALGVSKDVLGVTSASVEINGAVNINNTSGAADLYVNDDVDADGVYKVAGTQVVGAQQAAIADPAETTAANNTAIDSILAALRTHGLIAT